MIARNPAVQGRFYPGTRSGILQLIRKIDNENRFPLSELHPKSIIGGILPHAGHVYSGYETIPFFKLMLENNVFPETFVIIHPNHSGFGNAISLDDSSKWNNAIGSVEIDDQLIGFLDIPKNSRAHAFEHSCEVIIPFIQYYFQERRFQIVPVCMLDQSYESAKKLGEKIYNAVKLSGKQVVIIASSDFSHFVPAEEGFRADQLILDEIETGNPEGVYQKVRDHQISACGYGPIMALMTYAGLVEKKYKVKVLARGHSGEVNPSPEVVDYISMVFYN